MTRHSLAAWIAACGVAGLAGSAAARGGEAFLSLSWVDIGNNNGLIEPGESAIITLSSLQVWDGQGDEYVAFGGTIVDVITTDAGTDVNGHTIMNGLADIGPPGDTAEENGGNLENAAFLQLSRDYVTENPIGLVRFQVDFSDYTPRDVTYTTSIEDALGLIGVYSRNSRGDLGIENWVGLNSYIQLSCIPAPSGIPLLCIGSTLTFRRSRKPGFHLVQM